MHLHLPSPAMSTFRLDPPRFRCFKLMESYDETFEEILQAEKSHAWGFRKVCKKARGHKHVTSPSA